MPFLDSSTIHYLAICLLLNTQMADSWFQTPLVADLIGCNFHLLDHWSFMFSYYVCIDSINVP